MVNGPRVCAVAAASTREYARNPRPSALVVDSPLRHDGPGLLRTGQVAGVGVRELQGERRPGVVVEPEPEAQLVVAG